jgi:hypothetical protein
LIAERMAEIVGSFDGSPIRVYPFLIQHTESIRFTPCEVEEEVQDAPIGQHSETSWCGHRCAIDLH